MVEIRRFKHPDLTPKQLKRFTSKPRKKRKDSKHHYPLRIDKDVWKQVEELSLSCGGHTTGASLNVICAQLISYALNSPYIIDRILKGFPSQSDIIKIRTWGNS